MADETTDAMIAGRSLQLPLFSAEPSGDDYDVNPDAGDEA